MFKKLLPKEHRFFELFEQQTAGNIVVAWVLTMPGSALISALAYLALKALGAS
ncbi:MAG: hypothetical protein SRB2_04198 [Desulfobacteraceae bacterium Eth-SRB2]|nr:MAG: hypothetical protein SRB2_04198 [Desulfobacteraceae bacterium Eth-SRB2]